MNIKTGIVKQDHTICYGILPNWKQLDVKGVIEDYRKKYSDPIDTDKTNVKAWHSGFEAHIKEPKLMEIVNVCRDFCYNISGNLPAPLVLIDFWCMQYKKGDYAIPHSHWPSQYSVCYYADIGEGCSPLKFGSYEIQPENGMVIVFDGMLVHEVPPTDFTRTCVAMNFAVSTGNRTA